MQFVPPFVTVAMELLLEAQVTALEDVRFCVPEVWAVAEKVPMAISWLNWP